MNFLSSYFHFPSILCGFIRQIMVSFHVTADLHHDGGNGVLVISNKGVPNGEIPRTIDPIVRCIEVDTSHMITMIVNISLKNVKCKASENSKSFSISSACHCRVFSTSFSCRIFNDVNLKTIATFSFRITFSKGRVFTSTQCVNR